MISSSSYLKNLTCEYELQMVLLEKIIGNRENPLKMDEMRKELNLRFKKLNVKSEFNRKSEGADDQALYTSRFKGKYCNCGKIGHKSIQCTLRRDQANREMMVHPLLTIIIRSLVIPRLIVFIYSGETDMVKVIQVLQDKGLQDHHLM